MPKTEIQNRNPDHLQAAKSAILVIGGAEDKVYGKEILSSFFQFSGGNEAVIGIIPSASREPSLIGERYYRIFADMGAQKIKVLDIRDRDQASAQEHLDFIEGCTGIFLTGGDQLRLCALLADTPVIKRILARVRAKEIALAGTSAGAAVMGYQMIAGGSSGECPNRDLVDLDFGLGIIPGVLVDQHFYNRNRLARLLSAISAFPQLLGIGIDEDTCAMFSDDDRITVLGKGTLTILDAQAITHTNYPQVTASEPIKIHNLKLHLLSHGDVYDWQKRQLVN